MGFVIPPYNIDPRIQDQIQIEVAKIMNEKFPSEKRRELTWRPLRPEEIDVTLTPATRAYDTVLTGPPGTWDRILNAAADAIVPTGSVIVIFGWIVIDDPVTSMGPSAVGQVLVEGTIRNEIALLPISQLDPPMITTFDQLVVLVEQTRFAIQVTGVAAADIIAYPLAYRIGPRSQLDQG